ncbi:hypothetical protein ACFZ8E_04650 [Methylobacterium sp. HMF5984]|uniref:hypothetical protein n=1 Tax=Methylobacterium sp. HMF5984 TaxID=3367370 RepID=UPI003852BA31
MSASPLSVLGSSTRSLEWLAGPGALLSSTALSTGQLGSLGPIASLTEGAVDGGSTETGASLLPDAIEATANQVVLQTHAQIEEVGHEVAPANGPLHGLTNLGETLGLGHLGETGNLLTDLGGVAANPTGTEAVGPLLTDAGGVAAAAGTLAETVGAVPASGNGLVGSGSILGPATNILNQAVLDVHATLETVGHQIPVLNGPIHAVTGLGETLGLGHLDTAGNLLTDVTTLPGSLLGGGGLQSATPVLGDLGHVLGSVDTLVGSLTGAASAGGLLSGDGLLAPVTNLANGAVLNIHATLENIGHEIPLLNDALHGLTNLGETIGLGHLGESGNLVTDVVALPGNLLGGEGLAALSPILGDVGAVTNAAGGLLGGVTGLVGGLGGLTGGGTSATGTLLGAGAPLQPVGDLANGVIDGIHAGLEQIGHDVPILNDTLHSVIGLGNTVGLGELGDTSNLLTETVNLPGAILSGNAPAAIGQIVGDVGHVVDAAGGVVGSATGILGGLDGLGAGGIATGTPVDGLLTPVTSVVGGLTGGAGTGATGALLGAGAPLQPVGDLANGVIDGIHAGLEQIGHDVPVLNDPVHSVIGLGNTVGLGELGDTSNLLTDVANLPGAVLTGSGPAAVGQVAGDLGHVADAASGVLGSVTGALGGVGGAGAGTPLDGVLSPVTGILGGAGGASNPVGGLLGGLTGGAADDAGTHPLIDVAAGPATPTPAANLAVLTPSADPAHTVQASAIAVPADQPGLLHAGLLSGDGIVFPQAGGGGGDALVGHLLDVAPTATASADAGASHGLPLDLGIAAIDLGGHVDAAHVDPTPHTATTGIHLLGL